MDSINVVLQYTFYTLATCNLASAVKAHQGSIQWLQHRKKKKTENHKLSYDNTKWKSLLMLRQLNSNNTAAANVYINYVFGHQLMNSELILRLCSSDYSQELHSFCFYI